VQQLRRRIEPIRPHDRPRLLVDPSLAEVLQIPQRLTEAAVQQERAIDVAYDAVVKLTRSL
jgi:hypothetical protein